MNKENIEQALNSITQHDFKDDGIDFDDILVNALRLQSYKTEPVYFTESDNFTRRGYRITTTDPIYNWTISKGFKQVNQEVFYLFNENQLPVARMAIKNSGFGISGPKDLIEEFIPMAAGCFEKLVYETDKITGIEIVGFSDRGPNLKKVELKHDKTLHEEFYPYLDGGFKELIKEFILSEESILIIGGIPGSGKSVGIRETMIELGVRPIIGQDAQAIRHPEFVNTIFGIYDSMYNSEVKPNELTPVESDWLYNPINAIDTVLVENKDTTGKVTIGEDSRIGYVTFPNFGSRSKDDENDKFEIPKIAVDDGEGMTLPIMVVEDADALLVALKDGNELMQNLRNRTDGITKTKPVKIIFTTNRDNPDEFDQPLLRDGRCYGFFPFPKLTPEQAIAARKVAGLPDFEETPEKDMALATALAKPRKSIFRDSKGKRFFVK